MFESIPFFEQMHSKCANKKNNMTKNLKLHNRVSKNVEFYADSKFCELSKKNVPGKKVITKNVCTK